MYNLYPVTNLKNWFKQYGHLLKSNDFWNTSYLILLYGKSLCEWLERSLVDEYGICLGGIHSEHVESSLLYWTQRLINKHSNQEPIIIAEEKLLFIRLYQANQKLQLLPTDSQETLSYLKKLSKLFWDYECEDDDFLSREDIDTVSHHKEIYLQSVFWKELFGQEKRNLLTLSEALNKLSQLSFNKNDLPFSSLFYFSAYHNKPYLIKFLAILNQKGLDIHHICFNMLPQSQSHELPLIFKACSLDFKTIKNFPVEYELRLDSNPCAHHTPSCLLQAIQQTLQSKRLQNFSISQHDSSFSFVQTSSPLREIEVISDKILSILQDPGVKAEELSVVLMQEKPYFSIIEAIFQQRGIPYRFIKKRPIFESASLEQAFNSLLSFSQSDFSLEDILPFLSNEHVLKKLKLRQEDYQTFEVFVEQANILYAMDSQHKKDLCFCEEENHTWKKGFERVYVGLLSLDNNLIEERPPLNYSFLQWRKIAPFVELIKNLWEDTQHLKKAQLTLKEWFYFFFTFLERYLDLEENCFLLLRQKLSSLLILNNSFIEKNKKLQEEVYSFNFFQALLKEELKPLTQIDREGQGVLVGDLQNLSFLPSRFSFVLGMKEEACEEIWIKTLNLLNQKTPFIQQTQTQQLIRLIMHVEKKLVISYTSLGERQTQKNIYNLQRSACLNEIISFLYKSNLPPYLWQWPEPVLEHLIHIHPEHKSDPPYFSKTESDTYLSFNKEAFHQACIVNQWEQDTEEIPILSHIVPQKEEYISLNWVSLKRFFDLPLAYFFEESLAIHLPPIIPKKIQSNSFENFEPRARLWTSEFLSNYEEEDVLPYQSLNEWQSHLEKILILKYRQDLLEDKLYTKKTIHTWHEKLRKLHALISPYLPFKRENWLLTQSLESNAIGEWKGKYCQLSGASLYKTYRSGNDLFIISAFEKEIYPSDKAIMVLQSCLYKVHPYLKERGMNFEKVHILNNNLEGWETLSWQDIKEEWFLFWQEWLLLARLYPLPLCQNILKALLCAENLTNFHDYFTFIEGQLKKINHSNLLSFQKTNFYLERSQRYYQLLKFHPSYLPANCEQFFSQLKNFWGSVTLEVKNDI